MLSSPPPCAQEMRGAWRRAENAAHELSRARAEAEQGKHQLMEALVKERAARILAQQVGWWSVCRVRVVWCGVVVRW